MRAKYAFKLQTLGLKVYKLLTARSISTYLSTTNVQLGASYRTSSISTSAYDQGYASAASYIHASPDSIVLGSSTTQLFSNLSSALTLPKGSTLVLSKHEHETNVSPWVRLAARLGLEVKWWVGTAEEDFMLTPANLAPLLDEGVSFVACTHASNVLGGITDVKAIADAVHKVGGLLCVDGVSYAPHRSIDVCALGVDFYGFSWYKVYGPHIAQLYASPAGLAAVASLGHFFNPSETLEDKLGFAGSCYEAVQALPKVVEYLAGKQAGITAHEERLQSILLEFLNGRKDVRVLGSRSSDAGVRVATVSFVVDGKGSKGVVEAVEGVSNVGVRWGHFYSVSFSLSLSFSVN